MPELTIPNLFARRSIRQYTAEPVAAEQIEIILQAAMAAPSAGNRKPWHFVVVPDAAARNALADAHPHAAMLRQAPVCIVACGQADTGPEGLTGFWMQDLAAATENALLAALGLGLGAVWCGLHPKQERVNVVRQILGIPEEIIPFSYIVVGHPAEEKEARTQYDATRVHYGRW